MAGLFITFEGIEGCGKSTQIRLLEAELQKKGHATLLTREPGGTAIGEKIRQVLLNANFKEMMPLTELLLYAAARCQHVNQIIRPALQEKKIVLCDRYADATTAYQGAGRNLDRELLKKIHALSTENLDPNLTLLLDCPVETGLKRAKEREALDRFEKEELAFHEKVRKGYLDLAKENPKRIKVVDADKDIGTVQKQIMQYVEQYLRA
ncbi:MAG: dTMP kinase [Deltaproteobacteria bacterium]|nr:dTMP kinase [Deltaproteobacteria bacterium]